MKKIFFPAFIIIFGFVVLSFNYPNIVKSSYFEAFRILGTGGEEIQSFGGALNVHDTDLHDEMVNRHLINFDGSIESPNTAITSGDVDVLVDSTAGFGADDDIVIKDASGNVIEQHFVITAIDVDVSITVDRPIDNDYTISASIEEVNHNLNVDGTLASPVIFELGPPSDEVWHIERLLFSITDNTTGQCDDSKFGMISSLTNGLVFRENKNSGALLRTISIWKSNSQMKQDMFDVLCSPSAPAGFEGLSGRFTIKNTGSIIKLDGSNGDKIELLVQDPLSSTVTIHYKAQGHIEGT